MGTKIIFDLKLPEGTKCIALSAVDHLCIFAAFDVPNVGIECYVLNPNTGKSVKVDGIEWE